MYGDEICYTKKSTGTGRTPSPKHKNKRRAYRNGNADHLQVKVIQLCKTVRKMQSWEARLDNIQRAHHSCALNYKYELDAMEGKLNGITSKLKESSEKIKLMELRLHHLEQHGYQFSIETASNTHPNQSPPRVSSSNGMKKEITPVSSKSGRKRRRNYDVLAASEKYTTNLGFPQAIIGSKIPTVDQKYKKAIIEDRKPLDAGSAEPEIIQVVEAAAAIAIGRKSKRSSKIGHKLEKPHSIRTINLDENHTVHAEYQNDKNDYSDGIPKKVKERKNRKDVRNKRTLVTDGVVSAPAEIRSPRALQLAINGSFKCLVCDKRFTTKYSLSRHGRSKHSSLKPFDCSTCSISFSTKDDLWNHSLGHKAFRNEEESVKDSEVIVSRSEATKPTVPKPTPPRTSAEDTIIIEKDANCGVISKKVIKESINRLEPGKIELVAGASTDDVNAKISNYKYQIDTQRREQKLRKQLNNFNVQERGYCDEYECPLCLKHFMKSENLISHIERHYS